jgi:glycosyltransferase involved in cell wall biosynthesis
MLGVEDLYFPARERIEVRQMSFCPAGWKQKLHYIGFCAWVFFWTLRWRPKWIYASDVLSCPIALILRFLPNLKIIYHEHDSPNSNVRDQKSEVSGQRSVVSDRPTVSRFMEFVLWTRRRIAQRAELCVLPNEQRAERFAVETGRSTVNGLPSALIVWNCPSRQEVSGPRVAHNTSDIWLVYHGSIVPARLSVAVLEALTMVPEAIKLCIIGYETVGHLGYVRELRETANRLGIIERVCFRGAVPRHHLLSWCRKCDVGLAFIRKDNEDINHQMMVGASNKVFDYLASGLALIVSDLPEWRQLYVESGYGLSCDPEDPKSIALALSWLLEHPVEMRRMGERGRQKIAADWNYETQFSPVVELMRQTLL